MEAFASATSAPSPEAGLSMPAACALWAASVSAAWPLTQVFTSGSSTAVVGLGFTIPSVLGLTFVGMLAGKVVDRVVAHARPRLVRIPRLVALVVSAVLVAAGVWLGGLPPGA